jgi:hypothetical protein
VTQEEKENNWQALMRYVEKFGCVTIPWPDDGYAPVVDFISFKEVQRRIARCPLSALVISELRIEPIESTELSGE